MTGKTSVSSNGVNVLFYFTSFLFYSILIWFSMFWKKKSSDTNSSYVGFANLPNQVHRKYVKKGFEFTLMVVGESGLGKSTLINSLFLTDLYPEKNVLNSNGNYFKKATI